MNEGIIGLIGVVVGGIILIAKDIVAHWWRRRSRARYAAVRIVCVLTDFIDKCVEVVGDDGTAEGGPAGRTADGQEYHVAQVRCPEPPIFPEDIDWTSINVETMYRLLALPNKVVETDRYILARSEHSFPPDYDEVFEARWEGYANLGIEALDLSDGVRAEFKLPKTSIEMGNADWDPRAFFRDKLSAVQSRKEQDRAINAAMLAEIKEISEHAGTSPLL